jgi:hypothetical protein
VGGEDMRGVGDGCGGTGEGDSGLGWV